MAGRAESLLQNEFELRPAKGAKGAKGARYTERAETELVSLSLTMLTSTLVWHKVLDNSVVQRPAAYDRGAINDYMIARSQALPGNALSSRLRLSYPCTPQNSNANRYTRRANPAYLRNFGRLSNANALHRPRRSLADDCPPDIFDESGVNSGHKLSQFLDVAGVAGG
jgi:hypothetical protein